MLTLAFSAALFDAIITAVFQKEPADCFSAEETSGGVEDLFAAIRTFAFVELSLKVKEVIRNLIKAKLMIWGH